MFYVLPELSHDFILGNNFLVQAQAVIDYRRGVLTLTDVLGDERTEVRFGVQEISSLTTEDKPVSPQRESVLFSSQEVTINPNSSRYVEVKPLSSDDMCATRPFGLIGPHFACKDATTPYGIAQLSCQTNHVWLSNFGDEEVRIRKGAPVALFVELPRASVDLFAADLNKMELYNLPPIPGREQHEDVASCVEEEESAETNNMEKQTTFKSGPPPRDRFVPFEGEEDEHLSHLPRFTFEEIEKMSQEKISSFFTDTFLKQTKMGNQMTDTQKYQMKLLLLLNRDVFGKSVYPGGAKHIGVKIPTGDALPTGFPLRPTLPPLRPIVDKHIDLMLKHGIISPSDSPWSAAVLLVPKKGGEMRFAIGKDLDFT